MSYRASMPVMGWILLGAGLVALLALAIWRSKNTDGPLDLHTGEIWSGRPQEPGWTETVGQDGAERVGRMFEVNDDLMTADKHPRNNVSG